MPGLHCEAGLFLYTFVFCNPMNRQNILLLLVFCSLSLTVMAGDYYGFRVRLKDKGDGGFTTEQPEEYLSAEAIARREKQSLPITTSDLPIAKSYLDALSDVGAEVLTQSKWLGTVVVASLDSSICNRLEELDMVDAVEWVWKGKRHAPEETPGRDTSPLAPTEEKLKNEYGYADEQIRMLNGIKLHEAGFRGKGMRIAVIDAGFMNVDRIGVFSTLNLLGTHNVVFPGRSVFTADDHGTKVMACLAANSPGLIVGTAPEASYLLIKSEDSRSEYPIEEDYWAAAVEYADSAGVDMITSSLGYFTFDANELSHSQDQLDGKTAHITLAARMAAEKGILLFCSAGNEGAGDWEKITFPSDAPDVVTVGAITSEKKKSGFSSIGLTTDYRVKPDVVALGSGCCVIDTDGNIHYANGTSFATPILAGLGACLWQSLSYLTNKEIIALLQKYASQYKRPDAELGYGIPDVYKAYKQERWNVSTE